MRRSPADECGWTLRMNSWRDEAAPAYELRFDADVGSDAGPDATTCHPRDQFFRFSKKKSNQIKSNQTG